MGQCSISQPDLRSFEPIIKKQNTTEQGFFLGQVQPQSRLHMGFWFYPLYQIRIHPMRPKAMRLRYSWRYPAIVFLKTIANVKFNCPVSTQHAPVVRCLLSTEPRSHHEGRWAKWWAGCISASKLVHAHKTTGGPCLQE